MTTPPPYLAAAVQFEPTLGARDANVSGLVSLTVEAFRRGARLVVLPEMATTGYCWADRAEATPHVEPIPGPTTEAFADVARDHDGLVVVGMAEVDPVTNAFYNSAALVGPGGVAGVYRKTHAYITETRWARDGDLGIPVFDTPLGRLGILICMDAEYPEAARLLALDGCDVVCFPTNWLGEKCPSAFWMTRAWENGAYWVASNRYGVERGVHFSGGSAIIAPDGTPLDAVDTGDGIALAEIDVAGARKERREQLRERRPHQYEPLALNTYLWPSAMTAAADDVAALDGMPARQEPMDARVAVLSVAWSDGEAAIEAVAALLAEAEAEAIVLPPLAPDPGDSRGSSLTEEALDVLSCEATARGVHIVAGVPGTDGDEVVLLLPDGRRLIHQAPAVFHTTIGAIGLLTGDELLLPEPARLLAVQGAELIAVSGALDEPTPIGLPATTVPLEPPDIREPDPLHSLLPRVRAAENNAWLAFANRGRLPPGIFGPSFYRFPRSEAVAGDSGAAWLSLANANPRDRSTALKKPYLRMRLPQLYGPLTALSISDGE